MNLSQLRTELIARGFHFEEDSRLNDFINRTYVELAEEQDYGFLHATTTGTAPLTVADLRTIESVSNATRDQKLIPADPRDLSDLESDLGTVGTPTYYFVTGGSTINVYPLNTTDTLSVRYYKVPAELTADGDSPIIPARFHRVILDGATAYGHFDNNNHEAAHEAFALFEAGKTRMHTSLIGQQHDRPAEFIVSVVDHQDATY